MGLIQAGFAAGQREVALGKMMGNVGPLKGYDGRCLATAESGREDLQKQDREASSFGICGE